MSTPPRSGSRRHIVHRLRLLVEIDDSARPEHLVLRVHGELDLGTVEDFAAVVHRAGADRSAADLDLSGLTFCDVIGATAIEDVQRLLLDHGCRLSLVGSERSLALLREADELFPAFRPPVRSDEPAPTS